MEQTMDEHTVKCPRCGGPMLPVLAALFCLGLLTQVSGRSVLATAALLLVGGALYLLARLGRPRPR